VWNVPIVKNYPTKRTRKPLTGHVSFYANEEFSGEEFSGEELSGQRMFQKRNCHLRENNLERRIFQFSSEEFS
jgi:hypothetical protein